MGSLPITKWLTLNGKRYLLVHASPRDPMDEFAPPDVDFWLRRLAGIDVDFVQDLGSNPANQHLVKAIVGLAEGFGCKTIAEGVEDAETLALLSDYGVDFAQGFHLGRPAPIEEN